MKQPFSIGQSMRVQVPASTANLGPGFDSIGLALDVCDVVTARVVSAGLHITVDGEGAGVVPDDETHLVWRSMRTAWQRLGVGCPPGLALHCENAVPHSRGLGSSATAIVAGITLAVALVDPDVGETERLTISNIASDLEGHPDNASASVYGGLTVSWRANHRWATACPPLHPEVEPVVFVPEATLSTDQARAVLPSTVPLTDAARGAGRAALLIEAMTRQPDLLLAGTADWLHQESRRASYPSSMALVDRLRANGHAAVISGAGPSVVVLTTRARAAAVRADATWARATPGIATRGAGVVSL